METSSENDHDKDYSGSDISPHLRFISNKNIFKKPGAMEVQYIMSCYTQISKGQVLIITDSGGMNGFVLIMYYKY